MYISLNKCLLLVLTPPTSVTNSISSVSILAFESDPSPFLFEWKDEHKQKNITHMRLTRTSFANTRITNSSRSNTILVLDRLSKYCE